MRSATFFRVLVAVESVLFLLPTTSLFLLGFIMAMLGVFTGNKNLVLFCVSLVIPGYGLTSLWWLVIKYETESLQRIPGAIWVGIVLGGVNALWFVSFSGAKSMLLVGGGPLIVLLTLLILVWQENRRPSPNNAPNSDAR